MKKKGLLHLMAILMVAMLGVDFASCSSNEDGDSSSPSNPHVGTWYTESVSSAGKIKYTEVTYKSDFTCTWKECEADRKTIIDTDYGRYQVDGDLLSIWWNSEKKYWEEDGPWHTTFTINGNVMKTTEAGETTWYKK